MNKKVTVANGVATSIRLGPLRDPKTGQFIDTPPTFASGMARFTRAVGVGMDNVVNQPVADGKSIVWTIDPSEARLPNQNGPTREMHLCDTQSPKRWIDTELIVSFEGIYGCMLAGFTPTTMTLDPASAADFSPVGLLGVVVRSAKKPDLGATFRVRDWSPLTQIAGGVGWTRVPEGAPNSIGVVFYPAPPAP